MAANSHQAGDGSSAKGSIFNDPKVRGYIYQIVLVGGLVYLVWNIVQNTAHNLEKQNIASGFGFLDNTAGFLPNQSLIDLSATSTYAEALLAGLLNTLLIAVIGIFFATIVGFVMGIARLSNNWVISKMATVYIEIVRNIPLLLQLFFWYFAVLRTVPHPKQSLDFGGGFFLNNRGFFMPKPEFGEGSALILYALIAAVLGVIIMYRWAKKRQMATGQRFPVFLTGLGMLIGLPLVAYFVAGMPITYDLPALKGFNFAGGMKVIPEFVGLLLALTIYTGAFIAEIVRAGILAVSHGQTEASYALGVKPSHTLRLIIIPQAMRVIIPPLTSQYLNLTKNSSLAVAIAYPDIVSVGGTVLNQTGQAIEIIGIWMLVYLSLSLITSMIMNWYNRSIALVERQERSMSDIQAEQSVSFVRKEMTPEKPAPSSIRGPVHWMKESLFSSVSNTLLTLLGVYLIYLLVPPLIQFAFVDAVWEGTNREACVDTHGACWAYVKAYFPQFVYGRYPVEEYWRVNIVFLVGALGLVPALIPALPFKRENILFMVLVYPVMTFKLLTGVSLSFETWIAEFVIAVAILLGIGAVTAYATKSPIKPLMIIIGVIALGFAAILAVMSIDFGLTPVETAKWGGFLVTLVIAITGIAASLPLGIAFALGRRSKMPAVRLVSVFFIEFWRGVPLITVLFMSSVVLPLFLPEGVTFDKLLRALIGVALFSAAYMAEVVRGGLQAIPKGQYEGADALGLTFWQSTGLIIMPQALKLVIPGIVNTFIGLFKDTTLVLIIGLFDLLGQVQLSFTDPNWSTPSTSHTGYLFAASIFWIFCFSMSRYSIFMENRLHTGHKR